MATQGAIGTPEAERPGRLELQLRVAVGSAHATVVAAVVGRTQQGVGRLLMQELGEP